MPHRRDSGTKSFHKVFFVNGGCRELLGLTIIAYELFPVFLFLLGKLSVDDAFSVGFYLEIFLCFIQFVKSSFQVAVTNLLKLIRIHKLGIVVN